MSGLRLRRATSARSPTIRPACGPPSSLSPLKVTRFGAGGDRLPRRRLGGQPPARQVDQRAAAEVDHERHAALAAERGQLGLGDAGGEALHRVVAGVHLHQQRAARAERLGVVAQVGAVGGADLDQLRAGPPHDVRDAERAADLDQLAARHRHLLPRRQRVEEQEHRGGVVVDGGRRLGAGQLAQQPFEVVVAVAAAAGGDVVLEVARPAHHRGHGLDRLLGEHRAAEVGVQHRAGEVEHRPQRGRRALGETPPALALEARRVEGRGGGGAQLVEQAARRLQHAVAAVRRDQRAQRRRGQQAVDRRRSERGAAQRSTRTICPSE